MLQNIEHILELERLALADALEAFGLIEAGNTDAGQDRADAADDHNNVYSLGQEQLVIGAAAHGQQNNVQHDGKHHRYAVVENGVPYADGRALLRVVGQQRRQGLHGHVVDGHTHNVQHIQQGERDHTEALAGHDIEHQPQSQCFNNITADKQYADFAKLGIHAVIQERDQRIGDSVKNTGGGQDNADSRGGNAVADAGRIACHTDEGVDRQTQQGVAGAKNNLPQFGAAVLHAVNFRSSGFLFEHFVFLLE